jgi:hypothetical protein
MVAHIGYSVAERLGGRVTPCAVCTVQVETRSAGFLVEPQNQIDGLSVVWPQSHWDSFLRFGLKTGGGDFLGFDLKTGGPGFPVWVSKLAATI